MSRPRVWTGSKWQDLRFCYEPGLFPTWQYPWAEHINESFSYSFTSNREGWMMNTDVVGDLLGSYPANWAGGAIWVQMQKSDTVLAQSHLKINLPGGSSPKWVPGQRLVSRVTFSVTKGGSADCPMYIYFSGLSGGDSELYFTSNNVSQRTYEYDEILVPPNGTINRSLLALTQSTNFPPAGATPRLHIHSYSLIDRNTGQPALRVVQQGHDEAKAWNGSSWV